MLASLGDIVESAILGTPLRRSSSAIAECAPDRVTHLESGSWRDTSQTARIDWSYYPVRRSWYYRDPRCTCPEGAYWSIYPPYCPIHNPGRPQPIHVVPWAQETVVTTTTTISNGPKAKPAGEAMRSDDI